MSASVQSAATKTVFRKFIDSPAGPKTIHFWAPAMKWVKISNLVKDNVIYSHFFIIIIVFSYCWYWRYATSCRKIKC